MISSPKLAVFAAALLLVSASASTGADPFVGGGLLFRRQDPGSPFANGTNSGPPSPLVLPAPNVTATGEWAEAVRKARAFVAKLTLEEKVNLTLGVGGTSRCVGNTGTVPRLGFDGICLQDSPLGVRSTDYVSAFPAGINAAMTFDQDLIHQRGVAMGAEHRGKGVNVALGPMMNMGRVAAGGRNWEGFGADPYLTGISASLTISGMQSQGVIACAKHFVGNEQEHFRGGGGRGEGTQAESSDIDDRTLHEIYAWPFAESVRAGVGSIMCSYNRVNSTFACENSKTINGIAKEELGFKGFMLSDWSAVQSGAPTALAGLDMNMPGSTPNPSTATNSFWGAALVEMVRNGTVPEWRVDDMVTRTMTAFFKMGQDQGYPKPNFNIASKETIIGGSVQNLHVNVQADHFKIIREIGAASTVLLKNVNGQLPLRIGNGGVLEEFKQVVVFGSDAGPSVDGPNGCRSRTCNEGTLAMGWGSGTAEFPYLIDPLTAITTWLRTESPTTTIQSLLNDFNLPQATTLARQASSLCLVFVNSDSGEGTVGNTMGDRNNITLWHGGEQLIQTVADQCRNTVVVMHGVGPILVEGWVEHENVTGVVFAGLPGQESGNSLVDVLSGGVSPSGRLAFTIAKSAFDYPAQVVYTAPANQTIIHIPYEEGLDIDYRHFDRKGLDVRFEFGFGMSYTSFEYSDLTIRKEGGLRKRQRQGATSVDLTSSGGGDVSTLAASGSVSTIVPVSGSTSAAVSSSSSLTSSAAVSSSSLSSSSDTAASAPAPTSTDTSTSQSSQPANTPGGPEDLYTSALTVSFNVANTGPVAGHEVAQVYLSFPPEVDEPPKVLRGFQRKMIERGGREGFEVVLRKKDLVVWDVMEQAWRIPEGTFKVVVGASSRDVRLMGSFEVEESEVIR